MVIVIFAVIACTIIFFIKTFLLSPFSLSFGGLGHFAIMWSSDPHLKYFRGRRSKFLLDETSTARAFSFSFLILLKHFSAEWLLSPQNVHFVWTECDLSLCLLDPETLISRFRWSVCNRWYVQTFLVRKLFLSSQFCLVACYLSWVFSTLMKVIQKCVDDLVFRMYRLCQFQ